MLTVSRGKPNHNLDDYTHACTLGPPFLSQAYVHNFLIGL